MTEIRSKLAATALTLALTVGGLAGAGCVDHSGDKTFPRVDTGTDSAADTGAEDAPADDGAASGDAQSGDDAASAGDTSADGAGTDGHPGNPGNGNRDGGPPADLRVDLPG